MILSLIAAHDPNLVIGNDGKLPWHYKEDLQFFKKTTMGCPIIMGRGVFEELNEKPLPGRLNIVLTRTRTYDSVSSFPTIAQAIDFVKAEDHVFIIGGGEIYRQTIDMADRLYITEIQKEYRGDTFFPEYRDQIDKKWTQVWREDYENFSFIEYHRVNP